MLLTHDNVLKIIGDVKSIYDIHITSEVNEIRHGLEEIGIRSKIQEDGIIDLDVFDAMLSYISSNTRVILEVDFNHDLVAKDSVIEAMSTEYDISILPPEFNGNESDEEKSLSWDVYGKRLCDYAEAWLNQGNNRQQVYPVCGYLGYMVSEVFNYKPKSITEDPYIQKRFVETIPLEIMDEIKEKIKVTIYEYFGGKDAFEIYANSLAITSAQYYADAVEQAKQERELEES